MLVLSFVKQVYEKRASISVQGFGGVLSTNHKCSENVRYDGEGEGKGEGGREIRLRLWILIINCDRLHYRASECPPTSVRDGREAAEHGGLELRRPRQQPLAMGGHSN